MYIKLQQVMFSVYALNWNKSSALSNACVLNQFTFNFYVWTSISSKFILQPHGLYKIWKLQLPIHYIHRKS
ncbi:hypothetical protein AMTRI_Chr06g196060 [Amborella trichopoda]